MFRTATEREMRALLRAFAENSPHLSLSDVPVELGEDEDLMRTPSPTEGLAAAEKTVKRRLEERVRHHLVSEAAAVVGASLAGDAVLRGEAASTLEMDLSCNCLNSNSTCPKCTRACEDVAEEVFAVLERDMLQLMHGPRSDLFRTPITQNISFLLTGLILGMVYASLPPKRGLDELVLTLLLIMTDVRSWANALEIHGPVRRPPLTRHDRAATLPDRFCEVVVRPRQASLSSALDAAAEAMRQSAPARNKSKGANPDVNPDIANRKCPACKRDFAECALRSDDRVDLPGVHECSCGAVVIMYSFTETRGGEERVVFDRKSPPSSFFLLRGQTSALRGLRDRANSV